MATTAQEGITHRSAAGAVVDDTAQEGITHRSAAGAVVDDTAAPAIRDPGGRKKLGRASARHGIRSLATAVTVSAVLTWAAFYAAGPASSAKAPSASTLAITRAGSVAVEAVVALAAWMVWAEGGLHARPGATLAPFAAQLAAAAAWPALALRLGSGWAGMACGAAMAAAAAACSRGFGAVNPVAGDLAKPCVAWAVILAVVSYKML